MTSSFSATERYPLFARIRTRSLSLKKLALTEIRVAARPPSLHRDD